MSPRRRALFVVSGVCSALLLGAVLLVTVGTVRPPERGADAWAAPDAASAASPGAVAFESCASCHLADGAGRPDGSIPRLAGQRAAILEHKLRALAAGEVQLPVMVGFARALEDREIPAIAAHLASLPSPAAGHGSGEALAFGAGRYATFCQACHGPQAQGNDALLAPRLCGQHAGYLARRMDEIEANLRGDADPAMRALINALPPSDRRILADYLSREPCPPPPALPPGASL